MSCTQTLSGLAKDCSPSMGGVVEILAANYDDVTAKTVTDGMISAITMVSGKKFVSYALPRGTAYLTSTYTIDQAAGTRYVQSEIFIQTNRMDTTKRTEVEALINADTVLIAHDANGKYWLLGYDHPVVGTTAVGETGTAIGDHNGYNVTLQDSSAAMPYEVDPSVISGIKE